MDLSSTVTKGNNTLRMRIMSLPPSITSLLPCPDVETAGTMPRWKISSDTSKKKLSANIKNPTFEEANRSLTTTFASTTTKGYN